MPTTKADGTLTSESTFYYKVYSQYSTFEKAEWFIEDLTVTAEPGDIDTYTGKSYHWPGKALDFYAYAPASITPSSVTPTPPSDPSTKGYVSIEYTVNNDANEDFLVATPLKNQKKTTSSGTVNFIFEHMLSHVEIKVIKNDEMPQITDVKWKTLKIEGTNMLNTGSVTVTADKPALSSTSASSSNISYTQDGGEIANFMIVPQPTLGLKVTATDVVATVDGKEVPIGSLTYTFKKDDGKVANFEAGNKYILYFTYGHDDDVIEFNASVSSWGVTTNTDLGNTTVVEP